MPSPAWLQVAVLKGVRSGVKCLSGCFLPGKEEVNGGAKFLPGLRPLL